ncbi:fluoride efflux transporter FluC [Paenibacillus thermotolerans]|uniref:fluoride efflux transporter FluC n=1 Tax=Paenibacillus thermotolerans TaxID=3027807 RepID=UPI002368D926|nr:MULTISPECIES: CrcB family protein [unclassified Paenibacillus]
MVWLAVAVFGALGSAARWGIGLLIGTGSGFPSGTLLCNIAGSFALGWVTGRSVAKRWPAWAAQGIGTGLIGAFTTMSAFGVETWTLIRSEQWGSAAVYVLASALLGPAAAYSGLRFYKQRSKEQRV